MSITDARIIIHRYAIWCAARASSTRNCPFSVSQCVSLIDSSGELNRFLNRNRLYYTDNSFDPIHDRICEDFIGRAQEIGINNFSYGIAAKIINIYLKTSIVIPALKNYSSLNENEKLKLDTFHPPIDRILLEKLAKENIDGKAKRWRELANVGWSNFTRNEYIICINLLKTSTNRHLWIIEKFWRGFR